METPLLGASKTPATSSKRTCMAPVDMACSSSSSSKKKNQPLEQLYGPTCRQGQSQAHEELGPVEIRVRSIIRMHRYKYICARFSHRVSVCPLSSACLYVFFSRRIFLKDEEEEYEEASLIDQLRLLESIELSCLRSSSYAPAISTSAVKAGQGQAKTVVVGAASPRQERIFSYQNERAVANEMVWVILKAVIFFLMLSFQGMMAPALLDVVSPVDIVETMSSTENAAQSFGNSASFEANGTL